MLCINTAVFLLIPPDEKLMLVPVRFKTPEFGLTISIITSMFLHGSILHLTGNMLFLFIFGRSVEGKIGHLRFFLLYILGGIFAALFYTAFKTSSSIPVLGSSGAISSIMGAYTVYFFRKKLMVLIPLPPFKTWLGVWFFILIWLALQFTNLHSSTVAVLAHLGGYLFGILSSNAFKT